MSSTSTSTSTATKPVCFICYEESNDMRAVSSCLHKCCSSCMIRWIEKEEATGQVSHPSCPFCRLQLTEEETSSWLGRPFQPRQRRAAASATEEVEQEIDELTMQLLREETRPCPSCGIPIMKLDGCDLMECLCGFRFCFRCGEPGATCNCSPSYHCFFDNLFQRTTDAMRVTTRTDRQASQNGDNDEAVFNLRTFIEERMQEEEVRLARERWHRSRFAMERFFRRRMQEQRQRRSRVRTVERSMMETLPYIERIFMNEVELNELREKEENRRRATQVMQHVLIGKAERVRLEMREELEDLTLQTLCHLFVEN